MVFGRLTLDRTLISWNVTNLITVPLMAFLGFLLVAVIWQFYRRMTGGAAPANNSAGY